MKYYKIVEPVCHVAIDNYNCHEQKKSYGKNQRFQFGEQCQREFTRKGGEIHRD